MKIEINIGGQLYIGRNGGELQAQYCPFAPNEQRCGTWCPLFWEPYLYRENVMLRICQTTFNVDEKHFIDKRNLPATEKDLPATEMSADLKTAILNLMTDAIEGGYLDWAKVKNIQRDDELNITSFEARPDGKGSAWVTVTPEKVAEALDHIRLGKTKLAERYVAHFLGTPDNWDYDAISGDAVIQIAVLGELVYG